MEYLYQQLLLDLKLEDMLFDPERVVRDICDSVNEDYLMNYTLQFDFKEGIAKNSGGRDRKTAIETYSNPLYRYQGYNYNDILYLNNSLDHNLLEMFGRI